MTNVISNLINWFGNLFMNPKTPADITAPEPKFLNQVAEELNHMSFFIDEEKAQGNNELDISKLLTDSFEKMKNLTVDDGLMNKAWMKYLGFMVKYMNQIPAVFLEWLNENNYRTIFSYVGNYVGRIGDYKTEEIKPNKADAIMQLCDYVLEKFNDKDIPALMMKGQLAQLRGRYAVAEESFMRIMVQKEGFNGMMALIDCYNEEQCKLLGKLGADKTNGEVRERVYELRRKIRSICEDNERLIKSRIEIEGSEELKTQYTILSAKHARWARNDKDYQASLRIIREVPEDYPEYYRIVIEQAFLYQYKGTNRRPNPFYDLNKAIEYLVKADELCEVQKHESNDLKRARKSVLMPLANTYYIMGRIDEAREICEQVLSIDSREKRAKELLEKMQIHCAGA